MSCKCVRMFWSCARRQSKKGLVWAWNMALLPLFGLVLISFPNFPSVFCEQCLLCIVMMVQASFCSIWAMDVRFVNHAYLLWGVEGFV